MGSPTSMSWLIQLHQRALPRASATPQRLKESCRRAALQCWLITTTDSSSRDQAPSLGLCGRLCTVHVPTQAHTYTHKERKEIFSILKDSFMVYNVLGPLLEGDTSKIPKLGHLRCSYPRPLNTMT